VWISVILIYFSIFAIGMTSVNDGGRTLDFWELGSMVFGMAVVIANLKVLVISSSIYILMLSFCFISMIIYLISFIIVGYNNSSDIYMDIPVIFESIYFIIGNILILGATVLIDFGFEM